MKKNIGTFLMGLSILSVFLLTGCNSSSKTVDELFKVLQKQNIIEKDLKLIDTDDRVFVGPVPGDRRNSYIYANKNSKLIAIHYETTHNETIPYYVIIYRDITIKNVDFVDTNNTSLYYLYKDGRISNEDKYGLDQAKQEKYNITYTKSIFGKKYKISRDE